MAYRGPKKERIKRLKDRSMKCENRNLKLLLLMFILLTSALTAHAAFERIPSEGHVISDKGILEDGVIENLNQKLKQLEYDHNIEVMVVAKQKTKANLTPREYAYELFQEIGLGKAGLDNGLLILLVLDHREVVFEVGYGLEGMLTDYYCKQLQQVYMVPPFKENQWSLGLFYGIEQLIKDINNQTENGPVAMEIENSTSSEKTPKKAATLTYLLIVLSFVLLMNSFIVLIILRRFKKRRYTDNEAQNILILKRQISPSLYLGIVFLPIAPAMIYLLFWFKYKAMKRVAIPCSFCNVGSLKLLKKYDINRQMDIATATEVDLGTALVLAYKCSACRRVKTEKVYVPSRQVDRCPNCSNHTLVMQSPFAIEKRATAASRQGVKVASFTCEVCRKSYLARESYTYQPPTSGGGTSSSSSYGSFSSRGSSSSSSSSSRGASGGGGASSRF